MASLAKLLRDAAARLAEVSTSSRLDAEMLLADLLGKPRSYLYTWPEVEPGEQLETAFAERIARRLAGHPVAYLTGLREFHGHSFMVSPATLIPRPETELLVETALGRLGSLPNPNILDLGTGSGAIAVSIALARPAWQITATDVSAEALAVAAGNARRLGAGQVRFQCSDWWAEITERFDAVLSNPPYIAAGDRHLDEGDVRFEPSSALVSGDDGLDAIRRIVAGAPAHLHSGGLLAFEHGYQQGSAVRELLRAEGFVQVESLLDLAGHERVTLGVWHAR